MSNKVMTRIFVAVILLTMVPLMGDGLDTLKVKIGDDSPSFYLRTIDNEDFFIRDYCGEKLRQPWKNKEKYTVILSFFATWCVPCQLEIPVLHKWYEEQNDPKIKIILVDVAEKIDEVKPFIEKKGYTFPVAVDVYNMVADKKFGIKSLPHLVIIDPEGKIRLIKKGYKDEKNLRKYLDDTMKEIRGS